MAYGRQISASGGTAIDPPLTAAAPQTVAEFQKTPNPTILPMDTAGVPAQPYSGNMVAGMPYPPSAQQRLGAWNRMNANSIPVPAGVTYNAPRNRMTSS